MKLRKIIFFISILFILTVCMGAVSASEDANGLQSDNNILNENNIALDSIPDDLIGVSSNDVIVAESVQDTDSSNEDILGGDDQTPKTITVKADKTNPNQVLNPTVQPAIDAANPGDTIILRGSFVHCHFTISKPLNIIAYGSDTTLGPCPHHTHEGLSDFGVFYITEGGSGTTIKGFTFLNGNDAKTPFSILASGVSNIVIDNCTMNLPSDASQKYSGIIIENSNNVTISNSIVNNTINGISIDNSSNIVIMDCVISNTENNGIKVSDNCKNISIAYNSISNSKIAGISLASADYVSISNNILENNGFENSDCGCGIYVNTNITKLIVKGNLFLSNALHGIMYDYRCRNLNNDDGADLLTEINNNYFSGHSSMVLHHRTYVESASGGYAYDAENDIFTSSSNGNYVEGKSYSYMGYAFISGDMICGFTYHTTKIHWSTGPGNNGKYDFSLALGNITQIKKGVYQIAIVDNAGNVAEDFNNFNVTFYLNDISSDERISKSVKIQNGVATVDLRDLKDKYLESGNVITAEFPGTSSNVEYNPHAQFSVDDLDVPGVLTQTILSSNNLNMVYGSGKEVVAILKDVNGKLISGRSVSININGKTVSGTTNANGEVKLPINADAGTYSSTVSFGGDDEYMKSSTVITVAVSKANSKLTPYSLTTYPLSDEYFKVKLTDNNGKVISNQKITFKINGKTYSSKTDKSGIAKVKVALTSKKTYKVSIRFDGSNNYKSASKTGKIVVKTGSKKSKITAKSIKVKRNVKKNYKFKLISSGKSVSKQKVTVKVNGKTKIVKTNSKGVAKIAVKLKKAGKYKIKMKFLGNRKLKAASKIKIITVT